MPPQQTPQQVPPAFNVGQLPIDPNQGPQAAALQQLMQSATNPIAQAQGMGMNMGTGAVPPTGLDPNSAINKTLEEATKTSQQGRQIMGGANQAIQNMVQGAQSPIQQIAALAANPPQMPGVHMKPVNSAGNFFHDLWQGAMGLGMATRPGQEIRQQIYQQRAAPWQEKMNALTKQLGATAQQEEPESRLAAAGAEEAAKPIYGLSTVPRSEAELTNAAAHVQDVQNQFKSQIMNAMEKGNQIAVEAYLGQIKAAVDQYATQVGYNKELVQQQTAEILGSLTQGMKSQDVHPFLSTFDHIFGTNFTPPAPTAAGQMPGQQVPPSQTKQQGQQPPTAKGGPKLNEVRTINGQKAKWDGKGWLAVPGGK